MAKAPAFQFYVKDWLTDTELGQCSPATRGIWMDLLSNMWSAPERGRLDGTEKGFAQVCRCTERQMHVALTELERTQTASVTRNGKVTDRHTKVTVVNRRMWREEEERKSNAGRQMRHREKKKRKCHGKNNGKVTPPSPSPSPSALKEPPFPPVLDTPEFRSKWQEWETYRKQKKQALTPIGRKRKLTALAKVGVQEAIAQIDQSIEQGWQGLFPLKQEAERQYPPDRPLGETSAEWERRTGQKLPPEG